MAGPDSGALKRLPWRGADDDRPDLPLPPQSMPLRSAGGWRKRWRWVGAFGEEIMVCAGSVQVGALGQSFWAILDRASGELLERTRMRMPGARGEVWSELGGGSWELGFDASGAITRIDSGEVSAKLRIGEGTWAECVCPNGEGAYVWTRKRVSTISCDLRLPGGRRIREELRGLEDESAGYHPRHTVWSWSAGVGAATDGRLVGWNLVEGVNDPPSSSERAIWVEGEEIPREPGPVSFDGLDGIAFEGGSRLDFRSEAERARSENKLVVRYSYRQPFGSFSGSLDGIELDHALGVMESHDARW